MNLRFWNASNREASSDVISGSDRPSSPAAKTGVFMQGDAVIHYPTPSFAERFDAYDTIGRIFTAVESVIKAVNKRDFYFANVDVKQKSDTKVKMMEAWEKDHDASKFIEEVVRGWLKGGTVIIGPDFQLVPMTSVKYMKRDIYGKTTGIVLDVNGREWPLGNIYDERSGKFVENIPFEDYIIAHYIHDNRDAWGKNLYYAITTTFKDVDGEESTPLYKGFRQIEQDGVRMHHKIASPRTIWSFPKLRNARELDIRNGNSLAHRVYKMRPGDRLVGGQEFEGAEIKSEPIEGKTRFTEVTDLVKGEVEVSAQSSAPRLIEDPSAMADAREANEKDDDTTLYVCELVRRLFDYMIIPRVIGDSSVEFRWGNADNFNLSFEDITNIAKMVVGGRPVVAAEEVRELLKKTGTPLDDEKYKLMNEPSKPDIVPDPLKVKQQQLLEEMRIKVKEI